MAGEIKGDMSFTSQIQLEMKSNGFWMSTWQQLRLINYYSVQICMNARFHECSLTTGEGICLNFVCWLSRPPRFLPLMGSALCPGPYWPRLAAPAWHGPPAEPCTRQGKDKEKRISFRKDLLSTTFHLHFRYRKKYQGPKRHCFQTLDVFPPKRRKPFPNLEIIFIKTKENTEEGWLAKQTCSISQVQSA